MAAGDPLAARIQANGWIMEIDLSSPSGTPGTGGTYAPGMGVNNDPANAKVAVAISSPGYDSSGSSTTVPRTAVGTVAVRKPYPNPTQADEALVSTTLTIKVALSEYVYAGDTVTVAIAAGLYSQGGTPNNARSSFSVTNNSTLTHPTCVARFAHPGWETVNGNFIVEAFADHRFGIAALVFTCTDGTTTKTVTVNTLLPSPRLGTTGTGKVLTYMVGFQASDFIQDAPLTVNFKAYPRIGDSGAVQDSNNGITAPDERLCPMSLVCDKNLTFGGGVAVVDATNGHASTATTWIASSQASAESAYVSSTANSYQTIGHAVQAIKAWNNANLGRNDVSGGVVVLATNTHSWPGTSPADQGAQIAWLTITHLSTLTRAQSGFNAGTNAGLNVRRVKLLDISLTGSSVGQINGGGTTNQVLWTDKCAINMTGTAPFYQWRLMHATRNDVTALSSRGFFPFSTDNSPWALVRGNAFTQTAAGPGLEASAYCVLGNLNIVPTALFGATPHDSDNMVVAFNQVYMLNQAASIMGPTFTITNGIAIVQNVFEKVGAADPLFTIAADGATANTNHVIVRHNTFVGERVNLGYNDAGTTAVIATNYCVIGNVFLDFNCKRDTFNDPTNGQQAGRTGNWSVSHGVGFRGNFRYATHNNTGNGYDSWFGEFPGLWCNDQGTWAFEGDYASALSGSGGSATGIGNYRPRPFSAAYRLLPAAQSTIPYDLKGIPRSKVLVSAGAFEVEDAPRGAFKTPLPPATVV